MKKSCVEDIRQEFRALKNAGEFVIDKSGAKMLEIVGASFLADEETIFAPVNLDYVRREIAWYDSQSLKVADIPGGAPKIWQQVSSPTTGEINSNYGWCIYSNSNIRQYEACLRQLVEHRESRRAVMIYTRPSMQVDFYRDGMSDFMCTNVVQYVIRDNKLHAIVQMRSNDVVFGYRNDWAWQKTVLTRLAADVTVKRQESILPGDVHWQVGSLHVYSRHFDLIV